MAPAKLDDLKTEVQDNLNEVNLGSTEDPCITYVSVKLEVPEFKKMTTILMRYKDCFAWDYSEMSGLERKLVEHRLLTKD